MLSCKKRTAIFSKDRGVASAGSSLLYTGGKGAAIKSSSVYAINASHYHLPTSLSQHVPHSSNAHLEHHNQAAHCFPAHLNGYQSSEYVPGGPGSLRNTVPNSSLLTIGALPALRSSQTMIEVLARGGTIETAAVPVATSSSAIGKSTLIFQ
uniref:Ashwin n=1 Tax=Ascaris lumbricoides TaxID=6252 RepID=A0A0M3IXD1_ASCLU